MGLAIGPYLCMTLIYCSGQEVAYPFIGKPDRALYRDYYELIQHPVSLRSIQKKVRGTDSRKNTSKTTAYPTWQSFEEEVSFIWRNAREYNEDDSEISALAGILEVRFVHRPRVPCICLLTGLGLLCATGWRSQEACSGFPCRWDAWDASHQTENRHICASNSGRVNPEYAYTGLQYNHANQRPVARWHS